MPDLRIELLDGFRVTVGGRVIPDSAWRRTKPSALVKLLALAPRHRLRREQAIDALWPRLGPAAGAANLRKALHHARHALHPDAGADLVLSSGGVLSLPEGVTVDVEEFLAGVARARRTRERDHYERAVALYGSGLLPDDRYEDWASEPRDELHVEFIAILEEVAALLEARGDIDGAARALQRIVSAEPFREDAHAWLMRLQALAGRRVDALRTYERLRELLASELDIEPSVQTTRLYEEVRTRHVAEPGLSAELWERVGDLRLLAGDAIGAATAFASALEGVPEARLHRKAATAWLMQHDAARAEPHLSAAESLGPEPAEDARLTRLRANLAWERGELEAAEVFGDRALELAEAHGEPADVAEAREALAIVSHLRGDWRRGLELEIERVAAQKSSSTPLAHVFDIHHCIGQYHLYGDELAEHVEDHARHALAVAEEAEAVRAQAFAWCLLGESLLLRGRWDEAAGCLQSSCELHDSLGAPTAALPWQRLAELAVCRGTLEQADVALRRAAAIATVSPMAKHLWGRIHATSAFASLERGDPGVAAQSARAAARAAATYGDCPSCSALLNPIAAEAFAALGEVEEAREHAAAAARVADTFDSSAWRAMAESAAGSAASAERARTLARERFRSAAALYERARQPYWANRSLAQAAAV